jgi:hypothetical protein
LQKKYPDLAREFTLIIEENMPYFEKPFLKKFGKAALLQLRS